MNRGETLAETVLSSELLLTRYLDGFDDETRVRQTPDIPNHVAWTLGHCALTVHRVAEMLDNKPLSPDQFIRGDGAQGDATRFDTESVAFGSVPTPEKLEFFESIGVTECVFRLPSAGRDEVLATLDEQAELLARH